MEREGAPNAGASTLPAWMVTCPQRDPPSFAGRRGEDVEEWLDQFNRVCQFNRWDDKFKVENVGLSLHEVAKRWYLNQEHTITDWASFTENIRQIFGTPSARSDEAKRTLDCRWQRPDETYSSYIEDVLSLCRRVNPDMSEADKVRHLLKGIAEFAFNSLALQNPTCVDDVRTTCQRLDQLKAIRLQPRQESAPLPRESELRALIRDIIHEELKQQGPPCPHGDRCTKPASDLRGMIKEELASMTYSPRSAPGVVLGTPSYADAVWHAPVSPIGIPVPPPMVGQLTAISSPPPASNAYYNWRPLQDFRRNERPICFYCGIRGHISRFCRRRQQDERRGYAPYERDVRYSYGPRRPGYPPHDRSPSPQFSPDRSRRQLDPRRRSPSPGRRFVSPLRPVSNDANHLPEN